jgi:hypothetical protein
MKVSGELHPPTTLPLEKRPQYPLDGKMSWPQSRSGCGGKEKILPSTGIETWLSSPLPSHYN